MRERLMSLTQAAQYINDAGVKYSRQAIQRRCLLGSIGQKVGNQWVLTASEVEALLETLREKGTCTD